HLISGRDDELDAHPLRARAHYGDDLWVHRLVDEEGVRLALRQAPDHCHRLRRRRRFVEQRSIGDRQSGEVDHHLLEVEQRLEAERREHLALLRGVRAEMPAGEFIAAEKRRKLAHTPAALAYSSRAISSPSSARFFSLSLKSQPFSYGDAFTSPGFAPRSSFAATTSPESGA